MKEYYILINPEFCPRGPGYLGAVISRHRTVEAAERAQARVQREALTPIHTKIVTLHFWPGTEEYVGSEYCNGYKPAVIVPEHQRCKLEDM